jgi:hypothetical protein
VRRSWIHKVQPFCPKGLAGEHGVTQERGAKKLQGLYLTVNNDYGVFMQGLGQWFFERRATQRLFLSFFLCLKDGCRNNVDDTW